jgi:large subunit ribosomal protein L15
MLNTLKPAKGATHKRKRIGRGPGSGHGKTAARGHKGFWSRSGSSMRPGFEGGQMPLIRRIPKRGFTNIFRTEFAVVNVGDLNEFPKGTLVDPAKLVEVRLVRDLKGGVKILGNGTLDRALTIKAHKFSKSALEKIQAAGGTAEVI